MKTAKYRKKKVLKYKNYSKKRKNRSQKGCNRTYLGGAHSKTTFISSKGRRTPVKYFGRNKRILNTLQGNLENKTQKKKDCKLKRGPPRLKLNPRNFFSRRPISKILKECYDQ